MQRQAARARRRVLLGLAGGATAGALAWTAWPNASRPQFARTYETGTAQRLQATLPDGSRIELDAQTTLRVALYRDRRSVVLDGGRAHFRVAPDAARPFQVQARSGTVEVVGTVFTVAERAGVLSVAVEEGIVRLRPATPAIDAPVQLLAGDTAMVRDGRLEPVRHADADAMASWRAGWLVFDDVPLAEALPIVNAYLRQPLDAPDPRVGALRLTARVRAADARGLLAALPAVLPVVVQPRADGGSEIRLR